MNRYELKSLLKVVENPAKIGFISELQMRGLEKVNPYTGTLIYDNYLRILEEDKCSKLEIETKTEKDVLGENAEVLSNILKTKKLNDDALEYLQTYIKNTIIRCLNVGYQGIAIDYISLFSDPRITSETCPIADQSSLVKKYLIKALQGYARRAIEEGVIYHDKAISILIGAKKGIFGYDLRKIPTRVWVDAYNNTTILFNGNTVKNPDKLSKDYIKKIFKKYALRCNLNAMHSDEENVITCDREFGDD